MSPNVSRRSATAARLGCAAMLALPLAAQEPEFKPAPTPDPVKGWHDMAPMTEAEIEARRTARPIPLQPTTERTLPAATIQPLRHVVFDDIGDGHVWAVAPTYKASFGADGFAYVPFLGSKAPRNFPVRFELQQVTVGTHELPLEAATPRRDDHTVTLTRGPVHEVYRLRPDAVEQTFVIDSELAGDVELTLAVNSELTENATLPGIQFANSLGTVEYGQAHVVRAGELLPIETTYENGSIRIRVPAALRGDGPLVIDPIIQTSGLSFSSTQESTQPDIAYDETNDQFMLVWHYAFSATDGDIYSEFRSGNGMSIVASFGVIDATTTNYERPRVANLNSYDRFMVVGQRYVNNQWQVWARLRLANTTPHPTMFAVSNSAGHCLNPDIGGDSAASGVADNFLVVWERQLSATDFDIHGQLVRADTSFAGGTIYIENSGSSVYSQPAVSQSNGNGFSNTPRWLVAYQFRFNAVDEDIYGVAIRQDGVIATSNTVIDSSTAADQYPSVSAPNTAHANGNPLFLVTYERQNPLEARARLLSGAFVNQLPPINLSTQFGFGPFWVRAESDGNRFIVTTGAGSITVSTLAYDGSNLLLHEAPQTLAGAPSYARLCSKHSGGGGRTDYAIAYIDEAPNPNTIAVATYEGRTPGDDVVRRVMGCANLGIFTQGDAHLGETITFNLNNVGFDLPGFVFGNPFPASTVFCSLCPIGVDLNGAVVLNGSTFSLPIPTNVTLVGYAASMQGFALGSGPCALTLRLSDTMDFTVR